MSVIERNTYFVITGISTAILRSEGLVTQIRPVSCWTEHLGPSEWLCQRNQQKSGRQTISSTTTNNFGDILEQTRCKYSLLKNLFVNSEYFIITDKEVLLDCSSQKIYIII